MIKRTCTATYENSFISSFSKLQDPRTTYRGNLQHSLTDIIFLVISAVVSGADGWKAIELFGKSQISWLKKHIALAEGIPSQHTLGRVFAALDSEEFGNCFIEWVSNLSELTKGEVVAIDGKRMRGSYDKESNKDAIHMVSAFASENGLCLGQISCEQKSNEITAIPKLLDLIAIKGCTITIDAMGCQTKIAEKIRAKEAHYILAVKGNQEELHQQTKKLFKITKAKSIDTDVDVGHGRVETRKCTVIDDLKFFDVKKSWKDLKTLVKIETERFTKSENKTQTQTRYYISSLELDAKSINQKIRNHWSIENNLHWMLDVAFGEDSSRKRKGFSAENFNIISKTALSLITKVESKGNSKKSRRYLAALDTKFREKVLKI